MAFNVDGIKRPIRRGGQRQTRSAGTLTLFHATGPMQERSPWTETTQPSGFNRPTRLADGLGQRAEEFCR